MKPKIVQLIDSKQYIETNCFQHQLFKSLCLEAEIIQISIDQLTQSKIPKNIEHVISCLKMRTFHRSMDVIQNYLKDCPLVVYEQDPWHGYIDNSPWKGFFFDIKQKFNLSFVGVTTRWWANKLSTDGIPSKFTKMWMLPEYCNAGPEFTNRKIKLGFIGGVHSYRKELFDFLSSKGIQVNTFNGYEYSDYLNALYKIQIYIHSENCPIIVDGKTYNLNDGLWAREIEVGARGCISIRNWGVEYDSYINDNIQNTFLYKNVEDIPEIINSITNMNVNELQNKIKNTVEYIRYANEWKKTAEILTKKT